MPVTLSDEDYLRLLDAASGDDTLIWCDTCGAWLDVEDRRAATTEDFQGCWFAATGREQDRGTCVREHRPGRQAIS